MLQLSKQRGESPGTGQEMRQRTDWGRCVVWGLDGRMVLQVSLRATTGDEESCNKTQQCRRSSVDYRKSLQELLKDRRTSLMAARNSTSTVVPKESLKIDVLRCRWGPEKQSRVTHYCHSPRRCICMRLSRCKTGQWLEQVPLRYLHGKARYPSTPILGSTVMGSATNAPGQWGGNRGTAHMRQE